MNGKVKSPEHLESKQKRLLPQRQALRTFSHPLQRLGRCPCRIERKWYTRQTTALSCRSYRYGQEASLLRPELGADPSHMLLQELCSMATLRPMHHHDPPSKAVRRVRSTASNTMSRAQNNYKLRSSRTAYPPLSLSHTAMFMETDFWYLRSQYPALLKAPPYYQHRTSIQNVPQKTSPLQQNPHSPPNNLSSLPHRPQTQHKYSSTSPPPG